MKRNGWMHLVLGGALVLGVGTAVAQGPGGGHRGPFGGPMELMGFEGMHGGKVVTGAPFSATSTSTTNQTLQDGRRPSIAPSKALFTAIAKGARAGK